MIALEGQLKFKSWEALLCSPIQQALVVTLRISNSHRLKTFRDTLYCASFRSMRCVMSKVVLVRAELRYGGGGVSLSSSKRDSVSVPECG